MAWAERLPGGKKWRGGWRDADDKKRYTSRRTHPEHPYSRKRDALAAAQEAEVKAARVAAAEVGTQSATITWGQWWDLIMPERPHSDTDRKDRNNVERWIRPKWGDTPLNKIKHRVVKAWVDNELCAGKSAAYRRRVYSVFSWSMRQAVERGVLDASPCVGVTPPKPPKKPQVYATEQRLAAVRPYLPEPAHRDIADLGYECGLRPNELCGLHDHQVDLETGWLDVTHVYVTRKRIIRPWPKDKDARRVPLTQKAAAILRRRIEGLGGAVGCGVPHFGETCRGRLVFRNRRGIPVTPQAYQQAMNTASKRAGVPSQTPYSVRRGFATWAAPGIDPFALAEIMGHAGTEQTQDYVQQTPAARDRLRSARGEQTGLKIVESWGRTGADRSPTVSHGDPIDNHESTG